jgi:hypothetical protein
VTTPLTTDEIDIAIDASTGDIPQFGDLSMSVGVPAIVQGARIRMRMYAGEWFLNLALGVAYFARTGIPAERALLGQKFDRNKTMREFRGVLLGDPSRGIDPLPGILAVPVLDVTFDGKSRTLAVTWQASTHFGDTPIDTLIAGV